MQLFPVVYERQQLADSLARYMAPLGLGRRAKPVESLSDYLGREARAQLMLFCWMASIRGFRPLTSAKGWL